MSKKIVPNAINAYYAPAFEKYVKMAAAATLPPPVPRLTVQETLSGVTTIIGDVKPPPAP
jgi:hypothetical protein